MRASQRRDVIIHAQTMREDQLDRAKQLHLIPSFFSLHTYYWGDWHVAQTLGEKRAEHISPTGSALRKGMIFTEHHDAPVIPPLIASREQAKFWVRHKKSARISHLKR